MKEQLRENKKKSMPQIFQINCYNLVNSRVDTHRVIVIPSLSLHLDFEYIRMRVEIIMAHTFLMSFVCETRGRGMQQANEETTISLGIEGQ